MKYKNVIKVIENVEYRNYEKVDFIDDFVEVKEKHFLLAFLSIFDDESGWTVAHEMVRAGYKFNPDKCKYILLLANKYGWTVAHEMTLKMYYFDPDKHKDIILLATKYGRTVAHQMAWKGYKFDPNKHIDILLLVDEEGRTVAEIQGLSKEEIRQLKQKYQKNMKGSINNGI